MKYIYTLLKFTMLSLTMLIFTLISGCVGWKDFDQAGPLDWESWKKPGYTQDGVREFMWNQCGFSHQLKNEEYIKMEECMLKNGFVYHDIKFAGSYPCDYPTNQDKPSCQSIRNQK